MKSLIVIPARYNSSRFPGKPLAVIAGKTMLQRVVEIAHRAVANIPDAQAVVATDDERILEHAHELNVSAVMTPESCETGSDRALAACQQMNETPDIIVNLQGDAPLTPPSFVNAVLTTLINNPTVEVATPIVRLSWKELDALRQQKETRPFSGTTVIINEQSQALWFSKCIIPAIRKEQALRETESLSPVHRHIGLYGYRYQTLQQFVKLPAGHYETLEGLEQLRLLENGITIQTVTVDYNELPGMSGVDTPEDAKKAEQLILAGETN